MTVLSKSGASTDSPAADNSSSYPQDDKKPYQVSRYYQKTSYLELTNLNVAQEPPSYTDSVGGHNIQSSADNNATYSASSSAASPFPLATNYVHENRSSGSITGTWAIDTNIEVPPPPPTFLSSLGWRPKERPNLALTSGNGAIKANVILTSGSPKRAFIKAHTFNGAIVVKIVSVTPFPPPHSTL
jgi:hypothetical protein